MSRNLVGYGQRSKIFSLATPKAGEEIFCHAVSDKTPDTLGNKNTCTDCFGQKTNTAIDLLIKKIADWF